MPERTESGLQPALSAAEPAGSGSPATDFAWALLTELVRRGVRHLVVSPGSRSQALALAAAELERLGAVQLHVRIDERSAGFTALGIGVESGVPAAVITTSGSAPAHLHPAVLEAHHGRVPLLVLSADRPHELRGIRANQTTLQAGLFGPAVRLAADIDAPDEATDAGTATALAARAFEFAVGTPEPGPVHLNLALREPLSAPIPPAALDRFRAELDVETARAPRPAAASALPTGDPVAEPAHIERRIGTVVVAGAGAGPEAEAFARAGHWPLLAEVSSGSRFGPNLVVAARELLGSPEWAPEFGDQVDRVIVFGHPTLSREVPALIARPGVETVVVDPVGREWFNPSRSAQRVFAVHTDDGAASAEERRWVGRWVHASRSIRDAAESPAGSAATADADAATAPLRSGVALGGHVENFAAQREYVATEFRAIRAPLTRSSLMQAVWAASWPMDRLVFGASRLIREADRVVPGKKIPVHANRGLAGIDGTIATAIGIALAAPEGAGLVRVVLGDLAALHDVSSLFLGVGEARPRLQLIIGNDGGGTIFDSLEVAQRAPGDAFDRVQYTPQDTDFAAVAVSAGWAHTRVTTRGGLSEALTAAVTGPTIIEVPLPR
ncbi:2-succinyl-5-enolpyruvyl-6-hydroxy-3-cyclohexene-1-carboxylic-acid synthase [Microterricola pindariensis]|uniref:2-succinyl-5-enolpyruvyl-6-hydroxy-3-cyclohexene-1-carboxylate synthase n=1 Tax=Microterricola pindariensis TaxID=478010 RepID=A0ABX5ATD6_9MICO|nr:2-succinyl-5-enolpyruvyl-6-hydroxy-3-cyclohexene-1-carboxylic-acid synthase [Microterricola pindariensis]PPL14629.1 2-succinyl-5-enolpyruvyl-6-hydroxy-3-cyclohexene-1-carboxylic-acid synthase [Microterricola pindariensis]